MNRERLLEDAVKIDELLIDQGIIQNYMFFSEAVADESLDGDDTIREHMKYMSDKIVAMCFSARKLSWHIFSASGLPKRMGYYFQKNTALPNFSKGERGRAARPIICNETGEIYQSVRELAENLAASPNSIYRHLRGDPRYRRVRFQSYSWHDARAPFIPSPPPLPRPHTNSKAVREIATGETWVSAKALSDATGFAYISVMTHLKGRQHTLGGRIFEYIGEPRKPINFADRGSRDRNLVLAERRRAIDIVKAHGLDLTAALMGDAND